MELSQLSLFLLRRSTRTGAAVLCAAAALCAAPAAHAQMPVVSAVFGQTGTTFNYNFSVFNNTPFTLAIVNINLPTGATLLGTPSAPTGFIAPYDPGVNIVSFAADADTTTPQDFFAGTTVSGFLLSSQTNLNGVGFDALDEQGNFYTGTVNAVAAPEPSTLGLLAFAAPAMGAFIARRRKNKSVSLKG